MKIPEENICRICEDIFCCVNCRHRHEIKTHRKALRIIENENDKDFELIDLMISEKNVQADCLICAKKPLPMKETLSPELLQHIESKHLPLHCQKCSKVYVKVDDFKELSKCTPLHLNDDDGFPTKQQGENMQMMTSKHLCDSHEPPVSGVAKLTISTQTSPMPRLDCSFNPQTAPTISIRNFHWKSSKITHEEFISDSVSSIKNISSIHDSSSTKRNTSEAPQNSNVLRGKLVRSTSTPVHMELYAARPKQQTFEASNGQVSSIYNSGSEVNNSPVENPGNTNGASKATLEALSRYRKTGARPKVASVTPLRQVMSKSIQKAFAEHGLPVGGGGHQLNTRKQIFEASDIKSKSISLSNSPLDLRLSPALRRRNEVFDGSKFPENPEVDTKNSVKTHSEIVVSSRKTTTKSIVITRMEQMPGHFGDSDKELRNSEANEDKKIEISNPNAKSISSLSNSIFRTCESIEIFTSTSTESNKLTVGDELDGEEDSPYELADQLKPLKFLHHVSSNLDAITPITRVPGSLISKKIIKFETPSDENTGLREESSMQEVFYTPQSSPIPRKSYFAKPSYKRSSNSPIKNFDLSPSRRPPIRSYSLRTTSSNLPQYDELNNNIDDNQLFAIKTVEHKEYPNENHPSSGYLWTLVGAVMRKGSALAKLVPLGDNAEKNEPKSKSILRRCASLAGSLVRSSSTDHKDQLQSLKRKRTNTMDSFVNNNSKDKNIKSPSNSASIKRLCIQPRKPIERMRKQI